MKKEITRYPTPLPLPFSRAVRAGEFLFLSGQIPLDSEGNVVSGDITTQTRAVMERIAETLSECGAGFDDVVKANVWLTDMSLFAEFNACYAGYFNDKFPTRATVQAGLAPGVDVEIEMQAWLPEK